MLYSKPAVVANSLNAVFTFSLPLHFLQPEQHQRVQRDQDDVGSEPHQDEVEPHAIDVVVVRVQPQVRGQDAVFVRVAELLGFVVEVGVVGFDVSNGRGVVDVVREACFVGRCIVCRRIWVTGFEFKELRNVVEEGEAEDGYDVIFGRPFVRQFVERVADGQVALNRDGHGEVDASSQANLLKKTLKVV